MNFTGHFLLSVVSVIALAKAPDNKVDSLIAKFERSWGSIGSYQADFKQLVISKTLGSQEETIGSIAVVKPDKMRWESTTEGGLQLLNGTKFYNIQENKRRGNRVVDIYKNVQKSTEMKPLKFLSGDLKVSEIYQVKVLSESKETFELKLTPKGRKEETLVAEVDKKSYLLRALVTENSESRVRIEFSNTKTNLPLSDTLFEFKPGPKDVVHEQ